MMIRWPMMMAFAVLGIYLVNDLFPDQSVLLHAADLIKEQFGVIDKSRWPDILARVIHSSEHYPGLANQLTHLLGGDWPAKLNLLSFEGTVNPERILPAVILFRIPMGLRGMILVALIAASMSTFDSSVNTAAGYFVRDIYQRYIRSKASNKELISASWGFIIGIVALGFAMGYTVKSINDIWGWITMSFTVGLIVPAFLRFYWWRFNGGGFAVGTVIGMVSAILQRFFFPGLDERLQFSIILLISLIVTVIGTYLTQPTDRTVLEDFYRKTRPFGFWGSLTNSLPPPIQEALRRESRYDLISVPFVLGWQITLFLLPMQLIIKSFNAFFITLVIFLISLIGMYFFWYKKLPPSYH